jgi:spermidine synthase
MGDALRASPPKTATRDPAPTDLSPGLLGVVFLGFAVSGATALVLELVWSRQFVPIFGNSPYAISVVLCAFMAGLGLGGLWGGRLADRTRRGLLWFAGIEAAVALYALAVPAALGVLGRAAVWAAGLEGHSPLLLNAVRFALSFAVLVVPALLMGATLPLLARACSAGARVGRRVGMLYGLNTLGGAAGCFLAGHWLIQTIGLAATTRLAAGANLAAAAAVSLAQLRSAPLPEPAAEEAPPSPDDDADACAAAGALRTALPAVAFLSGFAGLACEGIWARYLALFNNYVYGFTNLLGVYLLGLGAGSLLYRVALARVHRRLRLLAAIELLVGLAVFLCFAVGALLYAATNAAHPLSPFSMALITVLAPGLLMGTAFPLLCAAYAQQAGRVGRSIGLLYALNTAGSVLGALAPAFVTIPLMGVQGSIAFFALVYLGVAGLLLALAVPVRRRGLSPALGAAILMACALLAVPHDLCTRVFLAASPWLGRHTDVAYWGEGRTATAAVTRDKASGVASIYINQALEVPGYFPDMLCFKLMGSIGPLLQKDPERVLMVAFGGGVAAGTVARFPQVKSVQIVELEPSVLEAARYFERENNGALSDPRISIAIEDGRNYLLGNHERWPVIICDSTHPKSPDSWVLYTQEFYRVVRDRLADDGVFVQWLPFHGLKTAEFHVIIRTFQSVFPHTSLWVTCAADQRGGVAAYTLLVATAQPLSVSLDRLQRRLAEPAVAADLRAFGLDKAPGLLSTFVCAEEALRDWVGAGPVNTDDLPLTQYDTALSATGAEFSPALLLKCMTSVEPYLVTAGPGEQTDRLHDAPARQAAASRRLLVGDVRGAYELLPDDAKTASSWRAYAHASDYYTALGRYYAGVPRTLVWLAQKACELPGTTDCAVALCNQALAADPGYVPAHRQLGIILSAGGDPAAAAEHLAIVLAAHPDDGEVHNNLGNALAALGRTDEAEAHFREAIRLMPGQPVPYLNLARLQMALRRFDEADAACRKALALAPNEPVTHYALASVLMREGRSREAADEFSAVLRIAPNHQGAQRGLAAAQAAGGTVGVPARH